jgi:hypothetical protein
LLTLNNYARYQAEPYDFEHHAASNAKNRPFG